MDPESNLRGVEKSRYDQSANIGGGPLFSAVSSTGDEKANDLSSDIRCI